MNGLLSSYLRDDWFFSYSEYQNLLKDKVIHESDIKSMEIVNSSGEYKVKVVFKSVPLDLYVRENV